MADINVLNAKFEKSSTLKTEIDLAPEQINVPVVHQVVKAILASRRQGNACTKTKGFVSGGGKKPYKQKGTGNARRGSQRSPIMVGGGTVFGPVPRDFTQKVNKKVMTQAIHSVIADKFQAGKLFVVDTLTSNGKTKEMHATLSGKNLLPALVVTESATSKVLTATRNIKNAKALSVEGFSVYEALKFENLVIEKNAMEKLLGRLV